jgi:hypothetical protein
MRTGRELLTRVVTFALSAAPYLVSVQMVPGRDLYRFGSGLVQRTR